MDILKEMSGRGQDDVKKTVYCTSMYKKGRLHAVKTRTSITITDNRHTSIVLNTLHLYDINDLRDLRDLCNTMLEDD